MLPRMRVKSEANFLRWASEASIVVDPKWATNWPRNLVFLGSAVEPRYWNLPTAAAALESFLHGALECLGPWDTVALWAKSPGWIQELAEESSLCRVAVRTLGPALDTDGAAEFARSDLDALMLVLLCSASFGWSWPSDLFFVSDQRDVLAMLDHHGVLWASFADPTKCDAFVSAMAARQWNLPTAPPDPTFKPRSWMKRG